MTTFFRRRRWSKHICFVICLFHSFAIAVDTEIDLTKVEHFPHKGRVQDKLDGQPQPVIDSLLARKKDAVPLLIQMLDDETRVTNQVVCYWPQVSAGDVALVILTDFFTDTTWTNSTLAGCSWDEMLESKPDLNRLVPTYWQLSDFKEKHGNKRIKQKWQQLWQRHQDAILWDEQTKCFRLKQNGK